MFADKGFDMRGVDVSRSVFALQDFSPHRKPRRVRTVFVFVHDTLIVQSRKEYSKKRSVLIARNFRRL